MPASWDSNPSGAAPPLAAARPDHPASPATTGEGVRDALRGDILMLLFEMARSLVKCTRARANDMASLADAKCKGQLVLRALATSFPQWS